MFCSLHFVKKGDDEDDSRDSCPDAPPFLYLTPILIVFSTASLPLPSFPSLLLSPPYLSLFLTNFPLYSPTIFIYLLENVLYTSGRNKILVTVCKIIIIIFFQKRKKKKCVVLALVGILSHGTYSTVFQGQMAQWLYCPLGVEKWRTQVQILLVPLFLQVS